MFYIYFSIIFIIIMTLFIFLIILREKKHEAEIGKKALHEEIAAGIIGNLSMTKPLLKLRMYEDFFIISCIERFFIRYEEIESFRRKKFLFSKLIINLKKDYKPKFFLIGEFKKITLYPGDINKVSYILKVHGVNEIIKQRNC